MSISSAPVWKRTPRQNLVVHCASGVYYAYARIKGRPVRHSLKTRDYEAACRSLEVWKVETRAPQPEKASLRSMIEVWSLGLDGSSLRPRSILYYRQRIASILASLGPLAEGYPPEDRLTVWVERYSREVSASAFNGGLAVLRQAIGGPFLKVKRRKANRRAPDPRLRPLFPRFLELVRSKSAKAAFMVEFLAWSGLRLGEAQALTWGDVGLEFIRVRSGKGGKPREVPINPRLGKLLQGDRPGGQAQRVLGAASCYRTLRWASAQLGLHPVTHHDLRHLFATEAVESGVDVPTVADWLGHADGGALLLRVYRHSRRSHSLRMAQEKMGVSAPGRPANPSEAT